MSHAVNEGAVKGDDSIYCQTRDGLGVYIDLTVLYRVDRSRAAELWANLAESNKDVQKVFVRPVVREALRMVIAKYSIGDVYGSGRAKIQQEIDTDLRPVFSLYGLELDDVKLRDVMYGYKEFGEAIALKQVAQQDVSTERQNLEKARYERDKTINEAQGDYQRMKKMGVALRQNPEIIGFKMAQVIGPKVKTIYMESPYSGSGR